MKIEKELLQRSGNMCELCASQKDIDIYVVAPRDENIVVCKVCKEQLENMDDLDENHWHCLNDSMWSEVDSVKVVAYRILNKLKKQELLDIFYLEDDIKEWALSEIENNDIEILNYRDSNGLLLSNGDTVVIIKDLPVKGAGFTAKQGTSVKNISLVQGDDTHIEGRVNGVKIHLKTCFLKKS